MRPDRFQQEESNQDSFLDVVANVVGVLIILVMLVGAQASRTLLAGNAETKSEGDALPQADSTAECSTEDLEKLQQELTRATQEAISAQRGVTELANQITRIDLEAEASDRQRIELAMHRQVIKEDIERRRNQLDTERQQEFDVQRQLLESQIKLDQLTQEHLALASTADEVETVECVPTPLAKEMDVPSIHLRLRKGLVSIVPVEKLQQEFQTHAEGIRRRLQSSSEVVETFGPIDGYREKMVFIKRGPVGGPIAGQRRENILETYIQFLPVSEDIGQNVEQALLPGSALYEYLEDQRRESPPVDVWLYTDSFDECRTLKRALWERGYAVAIRPLRPGDTIGASPYGSKSAAQ
jgi:hypothetical protein